MPRLPPSVAAPAIMRQLRGRRQELSADVWVGVAARPNTGVRAPAPPSAVALVATEKHEPVLPTTQNSAAAFKKQPHRYTQALSIHLPTSSAWQPGRALGSDRCSPSWSDLEPGAAAGRRGRLGRRDRGEVHREAFCVGPHAPPLAPSTPLGHPRRPRAILSRNAWPDHHKKPSWRCSTSAGARC